jgi:hypothetical protein
VRAGTDYLAVEGSDSRIGLASGVLEHRAVLPLSSHVEVLKPDAAAHQEASARARLRSSPVYLQVQHEEGSEHAEP